MSRLTGMLTAAVALTLLACAVLAGCAGDTGTTRAITEIKPAHLRWEVGAQHNLYGFLVLRGDTPDGPFLRLNERIIPATGVEQERSSYAYVDGTVEAGRTYFYRLEAVSNGGAKLLLGNTMKRVVE